MRPSRPQWIVLAVPLAVHAGIIAVVITALWMPSPQGQLGPWKPAECRDLGFRGYKRSECRWLP